MCSHHMETLASLYSHDALTQQDHAGAVRWTDNDLGSRFIHWTSRIHVNLIN